METRNAAYGKSKAWFVWTAGYPKNRLLPRPSALTLGEGEGGNSFGGKNEGTCHGGKGDLAARVRLQRTDFPKGITSETRIVGKSKGGGKLLLYGTCAQDCVFCT